MTAAKTVLVVDDSATVRQLIELNLRKVGGVRVVHAADGAEALEKIKSESPSVILTDINMPKMNGLELIQAVRAGGDATPIVVITTKGDEGDAEKGLALGASAYVTKPINGARLVETVRTLLK